jgi:hypothetical protein
VEMRDPSGSFTYNFGDTEGGAKRRAQAAT